MMDREHFRYVDSEIIALKKIIKSYELYIVSLDKKKEEILNLIEEIKPNLENRIHEFNNILERKYD